MKVNGVAHASITRLGDHITELKYKEQLSPSDWLIVQQLKKRLEMLVEEFRSYHFTVIDLVEEEDLEREQAILDDHDDRATNILDHLQQLYLHTECVVKSEVHLQEHI